MEQTEHIQFLKSCPEDNGMIILVNKEPFYFLWFSNDGNYIEICPPRRTIIKRLHKRQWGSIEIPSLYNGDCNFSISKSGKATCMDSDYYEEAWVSDQIARIVKVNRTRFTGHSLRGWNFINN
jgi:hypothetical protein